MPFGVPKTKFYTLATSSKKMEIFRQFLMGLRKFQLKMGYDMRTSSVNTPKTTSYAFEVGR